MRRGIATSGAFQRLAAQNPLAEEEETKRVTFVLFYTMISRNRGRKSKKFGDPFIQFLIGHSLDRDEKFKEPREVTRTVAGLQYFFRLFVVKRTVKRSIDEDGDIME